MRRTQRQGRWPLGDETGTALVEFALVLPLLLVLILGMIDVGKAVNYWNDETHLANEAARYAVVNNTPIPGQKINLAVKNQAATDELRDGGGSSSIASGGVTICIQFPKIVGGVPQHDVGDPVQVVVTAGYRWLDYLVGKIGAAQTTLTGKSTMRLEKPFIGDGSDNYTTGTTGNTSWTGTC